MKPLRRIALLALLGAAAACSSGPDEGVVAGDLFVATADGTQIDLPRVPPGTGPGVDSLREAVVARAWAARERALTRLSERSALTGGQGGRFAVDSVPSGEYRLWADAEVQGERWTWLERVRVRGGDTLRISLSNANADDDPFRCQHWLARKDRK